MLPLSRRVNAIAMTTSSNLTVDPYSQAYLLAYLATLLALPRRTPSDSFSSLSCTYICTPQARYAHCRAAFDDKLQLPIDPASQASRRDIRT